MNIEAAVNEALDNAKDNEFFEPGASLHGLDAFAIAIDLCEYDAALGDYLPTQLVRSVEGWLTRNSLA